MIKQEHGYLGPYLWLLNPRDTQLIVFKDIDNGPFWMSRAEQKKTRNNKIIQDKAKT
jgi:tRNA A22 N-methylase